MAIPEGDRRKKLIQYAKMLAKSVGIRQDVGGVELHKMREAFAQGSHKTCIALVRKQFFLTMAIHIQYVEGNNMTICIPKDIPLYLGPGSLRKSFVTLMIGKAFLALPFEGFIYGVAHEMSHVVLKCIGHELRNVEEATDITAMLLGFTEIMRKGRAGEYHQAGYLSDSDFQLVYAIVRLKQNG